MSNLIELLQRVYTFCLHVADADNTTEEQKDTAAQLAEEIAGKIDDSETD